MEPKNESLEDDFTFQVGDFQVLYNYMSFPGCIVFLLCQFVATLPQIAEVV